jgi:hypothetical protein
MAPEENCSRESGAKVSPNSYDIRDGMDALDRILSIIDSEMEPI